MPVSATYGWPTVGSSWDAAVFSAVNDSTAPPTANSETIAVSGYGVQTGTATSVNGGNGIRYFRLVTTGYTQYLDQMTTVVAKRSINGHHFGCCARTSNASQTYYVAQTRSVTDSYNNTYLGLSLWSVSSATRTSLVDVSTASASMTDLLTTSNSFVLQYRVFSVNSGTQTLHQARIWTGTDPLSPPSGAAWTIGTVSASNYYSVGYLENGAGLATGRSGLFTSRPSNTPGSSTITFSSYEYRNLSDQSAATVTAFGSATSLVPARYIGAGLTNASSLLGGTAGLLVSAGASLVASSTTLTGSATRVAVASGSLSGTSAGSGSAIVVVVAQAALQGLSGGSGGAVRVRLADGAATGTGSAAAAASLRVSSGATATGAGTLSATAVIISGTGSTAVLSGSGSLTATVRATVVAAASCSGTGSATATAVRSTFGAAYLVGAGIVTGQPSIVHSAAVGLTGSGIMSGDIISIFPLPTEVRETYTRKVGTGLAGTAASSTGATHTKKVGTGTTSTIIKET